MKLIEADAKTFLRQAGIAVPDGVFLFFEERERMSALDWTQAWMLKAQVLQGRRGKSGLIRKATTLLEAETIFADLQSKTSNIPCAGILCEPCIDHQEEWFVSCTLDRQAGGWRMSVSREGGMQVAAAESWLASDVSQAVPSTGEMTDKLHQLCLAQDLLSVEINPLAILPDGSWVALDAKIEVDDAAAFRHPEWNAWHVLSPLGREYTQREQAYQDFLRHAGHRGTLGRYVELDGDVAMILSGGGASLVAMDALARAGRRPANYVEMSGNPDGESVYQAAKIVFSHPGLRAVWIAGSFANFTNIQVTVAAILRAYAESGLKIPIIIRRDGPQADEAERESRAWAKEHNVTLIFQRGDVSLDASAHEVANHLL